MTDQLNLSPPSSPPRKPKCIRSDPEDSNHTWQHKSDGEYTTDQLGETFYVQTTACKECGRIRTRKVYRP